MSKPDVIILEGGGDRNSRAKDIFDHFGKTYRQFSNLFKEPHKLRTVASIDPDYIYIYTTGMMAGGRKEGHEGLRAVFNALRWVPRNVIFGSEDSVFTYMDIAKQLKQEHGTNLYQLGYVFSDSFVREINWI
jgi:hypothetical protein